MTIYYIDPTVGGVGSGTIGDPYKEFTSVPSLVANDQVLFKRGTIYGNQVLINGARATSTTLATPITIGAYGAGALPIIRTALYGVDIDTINGVVVQDLNISTIASVSTGGVRALNSAEITIQRCTTNDRCDYGIRIDNTGATKLSNINILNNTIEGTWSNSGILVIWGTSLAGVYQDVTIANNTITQTGKYNGSGGPTGIRVQTRQASVTSSSGTIEVDTFTYGLKIYGNYVRDVVGYGIQVNAVKSGSTETLKNIIYKNIITNTGMNGTFDSHMLWVGGCRDIVIEDNTLNTSTMLIGGSTGTGIGIFADSGNADGYSGCKNITIRRNSIANTGQHPENNLNSSEVRGCGILVLWSQTVTVYDNDVVNCYNGIGTVWGGGGLATSNVIFDGNRINAINVGASIITQSDLVTVKNNYIEGATGIYIQNSGGSAITNYTETGNTVLATSPYVQADSTTIPVVTTRTPSSTNKTLTARIAKLSQFKL